MIKAINRSIAARHEEDEKGFTLIELLVVILIIGVLAAIAIPAFLNQRQSAWEAQVKSDVANAIIAAESLAVDNNGSYATLTDAALTAKGYLPTDGVTITVSGAAATEYILTGTHSSLPATFKLVYTHSTGKTVKTP